MPVEIKIFPSPTNGETMLPNKNPAAPNKAEPVPACSRAFSIARVVPAVKVSPSVKSSNSNNPSNIHTDAWAAKAIHTSTLSNNMPPQLMKIHVSCRLNLTEMPAPVTIASEFKPKNKLNAKGLNP